jgi:para-nitrobenzyl esterase
MERSALLFGIACFVAATQLTPAALPQTVKIDSGSISGTTAPSGIHIFKGIPFAAPPVGNLRWRAPEPAAHWDGVRKAEEFAPRCISSAPAGPGRGGRGRQGGRDGAPAAGRQNAAPPPAAAQALNALRSVPEASSEDCLYLNVWTGANAASERRPVMLWIYGGGFTGGAGSLPAYGGEALAKKGIVVVTFNYRLGPFGWLAHPELTRESGRNASGNYGMMDAIAALRWIKRNIASFGGDPAKVTIAGESAGAFMVAGLVGSPQARGLFVHAIAESGAWMGLRMGKMTTRASAEETGRKAVEEAGASSIAELRGKPAADLQRQLRAPAALIVDGWLVPEDLTAVFIEGRQNPVDVLVGSNKDEGALFQFGRTQAAQFADQSKARWGDLSDSFLKLYPAANDEEANASSLAASRDEITWHMRLWGQVTAKRGKKAYVYYFTHTPDGDRRGATHTAELVYVFDTLQPGKDWPAVDKQLADTMSSYWANFVKTGDPNGQGLPAWPVYKDKATGRAMVLGDTVGPEAAPDAQRLALYDSLFMKQVVPASNTTASAR